MQSFVFLVTPWMSLAKTHHRGTENTEVAQSTSNRTYLGLKLLCQPS